MTKEEGGNKLKGRKMNISALADAALVLLMHLELNNYTYTPPQIIMITRLNNYSNVLTSCQEGTVGQDTLLIA